MYFPKVNSRQKEIWLSSIIFPKFVFSSSRKSPKVLSHFIRQLENTSTGVLPGNKIADSCS